jgi:hypothetical protein
MGRDARDHDERCECNQDVDEAAQNDAACRVPWLRLSRSLDTGDPQGIESTEVEQAARSFGAAAAQLGENELGAKSRIPDEPESLGPLTSAAAYVAGIAGNGSDRIASPQPSTAFRIKWQWQRNVYRISPGKGRPLRDALALSAQGIAAWRRSRRAWRAASVSDGP